MTTEQQLKICRLMFGRLKKAHGVFYWTQDKRLINIVEASVIYTPTSVNRTKQKNDIVFKKDFLLVRRELPTGLNYTTWKTSYAIDMYSMTGKYLARLENVRYDCIKEEMQEVHLENGIVLIHNIIINTEKQNKRIFVYNKKLDSIVQIIRNVESFVDCNDHVCLSFIKNDTQGKPWIKKYKLYKEQKW